MGSIEIKRKILYKNTIQIYQFLNNHNIKNNGLSIAKEIKYGMSDKQIEKMYNQMKDFLL